MEHVFCSCSKSLADVCLLRHKKWPSQAPWDVCQTVHAMKRNTDILLAEGWGYKTTVRAPLWPCSNVSSLHLLIKYRAQGGKLEKNYCVLRLNYISPTIFNGGLFEPVMPPVLGTFLPTDAFLCRMGRLPLALPVDFTRETTPCEHFLLLWWLSSFSLHGVCHHVASSAECKSPLLLYPRFHKCRHWPFNFGVPHQVAHLPEFTRPGMRWTAVCVANKSLAASRDHAGGLCSHYNRRYFAWCATSAWESRVAMLHC